MKYKKKYDNPDILYTIDEMLDQVMSSSDYGIGQIEELEGDISLIKGLIKLIIKSLIEMGSLNVQDVCGDSFEGFPKRDEL